MISVWVGNRGILWTFIYCVTFFYKTNDLVVGVYILKYTFNACVYRLNGAPAMKLTYGKYDVPTYVTHKYI